MAAATTKGHEFGYYVPKVLTQKFGEMVPRSISMSDAAASLYSVVDQCEKELKEAFSDKDFLQLIKPKTEKVQDSESGYRTMIARFSSKATKEKTRKAMKLMASKLSVGLEREVHAYNVASGLFFLFVKESISVDF